MLYITNFYTVDGDTFKGDIYEQQGSPDSGV